MRKLCLLILVALLVSTMDVMTRAERATLQPVDLLQILPDGSGVVVIDLQKITTSALWSSINAQQKLKGVIDKAQSEITGLGVSLSDVRAIALVFSSANFNSPIAAINGGFDQKDLLDRLRSNVKIRITSEKYKNFDVYRAKPVPSSDSKSSERTSSGTAVNNETSFVFRDASTIVVGTIERVRASIDVMSGARASINQNSQLTDGLAQNPAAAVKFAIALTPSMTSGLQSSDLPFDFSTVKLICGSIDVSSGIDLNATLRSDTDEHAKSIAERLNALLGMAKGYLGAAGSSKSAPIVDALKAVNITTLNADVKITGNFPADLLSSLFNPAGKKGQ